MRLDNKAAFVIGLAGAAVAQFIALMLAGAGHGWVMAFYASAALWILMPTALVVASGTRRHGRFALVALLIAALSANICLVIATKNEGIKYFDRTLDGGMLPFTIAWLALWFSWQIFVLIALVRKYLVGGGQ